MINRVRNARIFRHALIVEVELTRFAVDSYVFEQRITLNCAINIGFAFLIEANYFRVAATFIVEDALIVPSVLIVTDQSTLRVS